MQQHEWNEKSGCIGMVTSDTLINIDKYIVNTWQQYLNFFLLKAHPTKYTCFNTGLV